MSQRNQCHLCAHAPDLGHESISNGWTDLYCGCIAGATGDAFVPKANSIWHHLLSAVIFFLPRLSWEPTKSMLVFHWVCSRIQEVVFHISKRLHGLHQECTIKIMKEHVRRVTSMKAFEFGQRKGLTWVGCNESKLDYRHRIPYEVAEWSENAGLGHLGLKLRLCTPKFDSARCDQKRRLATCGRWWHPRPNLLRMRTEIAWVCEHGFEWKIRMQIIVRAIETQKVL